MEKNEIPGIVNPKKRKGETRWQRYWRRRRMNSIRNSSDHAVFMALALFAVIAILALIAFFGMRDANLPAPTSGGLEMFK